MERSLTQLVRRVQEPRRRYVEILRKTSWAGPDAIEAHARSTGGRILRSRATTGGSRCGRQLSIVDFSAGETARPDASRALNGTSTEKPLDLPLEFFEGRRVEASGLKLE